VTFAPGSLAAIWAKSVCAQAGDRLWMHNPSATKNLKKVMLNFLLIYDFGMFPITGSHFHSQRQQA
jgi:hypothetical protein